MSHNLLRTTRRSPNLGYVQTFWLKGLAERTYWLWWRKGLVVSGLSPMYKNTRISVLAPDSTPLMPMKFYRAEARVQSGQAEWVSNDLNIKQIRLRSEPSGRNVQDVVAAIDPGKLFSGVAVGSAKFTLFMAHLVLPFPNVAKKMSARCILRRARRGRRINRKLPMSFESFHTANS